MALPTYIGAKTRGVYNIYKTDEPSLKKDFPELYRLPMRLRGKRAYIIEVAGKREVVSVNE